MRRTIAILAGAAVASLAGAAVSQPPAEVIARPDDGTPPCGWFEARPIFPGPETSRAGFVDLLLGQRLRPAHERRIADEMRRRFPSEATGLFLSILAARPLDSDENVALFESIVARHRRSRDPLVQIEVARARFLLIEAERSRHIAAEEEGFGNLYVEGTWRRTEAGRRWSARLDAFLRDYRRRGPDFAEFVAPLEFSAAVREAAARVPDAVVGDQRFLDPRVAAIRARLRRRMRALIDRYAASPNERVQRAVVEAMDMLSPYEQGRAALIPVDREIVARFRDARDIDLRHAVNGSWHRLRMSLEETGDAAGAALAELEHRAWRTERLDLGCN
ncbi:MAG TPA: hypothetical protein VF702_10215 [Allosphingosinicella sp.]|jgi:hypothetical protein